MANKLSTAELESEVDGLSSMLLSSEWDDEVKGSYFRFIEVEKKLIADMKWYVERANIIDDHMASWDSAKLRSKYRECVSKFNQLQ